MSFTLEELNAKTVAELKKIATEIDHEALKGFSKLKKDALVAALCTALDIEPGGAMKKKKSAPTAPKKKAPAAPAAKINIDLAVDKAGIKAQITALKKRRAQAIAEKNRPELKQVRRALHRLKRGARRAQVAA